MKDIHLIFGVITIALTAVAGGWGAWCWWRVRSSAWFWRLLRASQAAVVVQAALGGVLVLTGHKPPGLHVLYGVLPLLVSFFAEQLRISAAQMVLDQRGFESSQEVGKLPAERQQEVVVAILQRELGFMVLAALVNLVLLGRAAMTH
jgi:heme A synthase